MSQEFDPKKIIDFTKDYYTLLDLTKEDLPRGNSRQDKIELSEKIEVAFRKKARKCHPDFGGSKEEFLDIVRARRILEDPILKKIFDQGYFDEFNVESLEDNEFQIDWNKIGTYRKGTPEDSIGFGLFLNVNENKNELGLTPAFFPSSNEHNYEWDWQIKDSDAKLVIALVHDEEDVLRLTSSDKIDNSLPFKIYICIPRASLYFSRDDDGISNPHGMTLMNGSINKVSYLDYELLESTSIEDTHKYIEEQLQKDLEDFRNGNLSTKIKKVKNQSNWMSSEQLKKFDRERLNSVMKFKSFYTADNKNAADFLDKLSD